MRYLWIVDGAIFAIHYVRDAHSESQKQLHNIVAMT